MSVRQERLSLLSRINCGRLRIPEMLNDLSAALGSRVELDALLGLPESDILLNKISEGYRRARNGEAGTFRRLFNSSESQAAIALIADLGSRIASESAILWLKDSKYCGAFNVNVGAALQNSIQVIKIDGDSLRLLSTDQDCGILFDWNPDDRIEFFDIAIWGVRWVEQVNCKGIE